MNIRVHNIKLGLDADFDEIKEAAIKKVSLKDKDVVSFRISKQSVDARKKQVSFVYSADITTSKNVKPDGINIFEIKEDVQEEIKGATLKLEKRPIVVGTGPCGLFCALTLARNGFSPIVLERGADVDERTSAVDTFWRNGTFAPETNVQFGEGGAGTFSDGKLTTRISDPKIMSILEDFVRFGAPEEILYKAKPHIGTDILKNVVKRIRNEIIALGGEVRFNTQVTDITIRYGKIASVTVSGGEEIECNVLVLALGHSARDTYKMLFYKGVAMEAKPFSVGVRAEHLRSYIDEAMYGDFAGHPKLGAADYQLSWRNGEDACYSFCMCPGGVVVAAASEEKTVVTNGMSYFARDGKNSNAAICVNVTSKDFDSQSPLAGIEYQRNLEKLAFAAGGENYFGPCQLITDFLDGKPTKKLGSVEPTYMPGVKLADLNGCFSTRVSDVLSCGFRQFERKIKGYTTNDAIITGIETRTSAPVRILRSEKCESLTVGGVYPAGEGAGYAGGIMSAAADGIKVAEKILGAYVVVF